MIEPSRLHWYVVMEVALALQLIFLLVITSGLAHLAMGMMQKDPPVHTHTDADARFVNFPFPL